MHIPTIQVYLSANFRMSRGERASSDSMLLLGVIWAELWKVLWVPNANGLLCLVYVLMELVGGLVKVGYVKNHSAKAVLWEVDGLDSLQISLFGQLNCGNLEVIIGDDN